MNKTLTENKNDTNRIAEFELSLIKLYGVVIGGNDLRHILGYRNADSFRKAVFDKRIPFPTFIPEGRKMRMARARDIAIWLASLDTVVEGIDENYKEL